MKKFVSAYGATGRRNFVLFLISLIACGVILRIVYLQVYRADYLVKQGDLRHIRNQEIPAMRGMILDRNKFPLAVSTVMSSIWINPLEVENNTKSIKEISDVLSIPYAQLLDKYQQNKNKQFMYVKRIIPPDIAETLMKKKLKGVYQKIEYKRYYPSSDVTAQVVGYNNIDDKGQEGVELEYDDLLSGAQGVSEVIKSQSGKIVEVLNEISPMVQGQDITLTIDKRIQYFAYQDLLDQLNATGAKSATAVVLDAKTSEILAMVSVPSGNPNISNQRSSNLIKNRAMTDTFEPGSVMKPLLISAALEQKIVTPNTMFDTNPGWFKVGKNIVRDDHNYGKLDVIGIIRKSSNVGVSKVALLTPRDAVYNLFKSFGIGQKSEIGFAGEQRGVLRNLTKLSDFDYATNAFGYGLSVNALQLAQAYAVLANDGVKIPVTLIKSSSPKTGTRIISSKTARAVRQMLLAAVEDKGTGTRAQIGEYIKDYVVGGKTGTAHKVINGQYAKDKYFSVFAGIAPLDNPDLVMVVMIDEPKGAAYFGGLAAAPVFAKVIGKALRIRNVKPDRFEDSSDLHDLKTKKTDL